MEHYNSLKHSHKLFVDHYLKTGNATQAYKNAGYTHRNAHSNVTRLMSNDTIAKAIEERKEQLFKDLNITEDDLKRVWKEILNDPDAKASDKLACTKIVGDYLKIFNNTPQIAIFQGISKDMLKVIQTDRDDAIDIEHTIYRGDNLAVEGIEC